MDAGPDAPQGRRVPGHHRVPDRVVLPVLQGAGGAVPVPVRRAVGPVRRGSAGRGGHRQVPGRAGCILGAGLRVPLAARVQVEVPAAALADVHGVPGRGRPAADRHRHHPGLPAERRSAGSGVGRPALSVRVYPNGRAGSVDRAHGAGDSGARPT